MKIVSTNVYVGPNVFAHFRVIRHVLDLGVLEEWPSMRLGESFIGALLEALPGLHEHGCSYREPGGFVKRLHEDEGTWMGHVMEHVAIELQNVAGSPVTYGRTRSIEGQPGHYNMVFEYKDESVGLESSKIAMKVLLSLLHSAHHGSPGARKSVEILTRTFYAKWFWGALVGVGLALPALLLAVAQSYFAVILAAAGVLIGFYAFRVLIFKAGVFEPIMSFRP